MAKSQPARRRDRLAQTRLAARMTNSSRLPI